MDRGIGKRLRPTASWVRRMPPLPTTEWWPIQLEIFTVRLYMAGLTTTAPFTNSFRRFRFANHCFRTERAAGSSLNMQPFFEAINQSRLAKSVVLYVNETRTNSSRLAGYFSIVVRVAGCESTVGAGKIVQAHI